MPPADDREAFTPPPTFSIETAPAPEGVVLLVLAGEVDLATSGDFRRHVESAYEVGAGRVVVDMAEVTFVDSTMLRELLRAHRALRERGAELVLAGVQPSVRRLLELTGTLDVFELAAGRAEALAQAG